MVMVYGNDTATVHAYANAYENGIGHAHVIFVNDSANVNVIVLY